jgi:hypothetical protein
MCMCIMEITRTHTHTHTHTTHTMAASGNDHLSLDAGRCPSDNRTELWQHKLLLGKRNVQGY